ncbi:coiled-coil domain-containing protein [Falsigemmobacter faecalis]|uniref:Uncharacterized protein n=1 Tax=Falsigemmobacter faecalis TaxID=2488730 RepID=A0A3P3D155_9RHOB|nr:hypothetical protein [Falsigemmobacter faecalis]RRH68149.1 hypothetical protein EG244_19785 [Falsigemmobacter faecalis]
MQEFEQHQRRLATALLRIGAAFERLGEPPPASQVLARAQDHEDLSSEIEIARLTRLAEEARAEVAALSEQLVGTHATLEEVVLELSAQIESRDLELAELRAAPVAAVAPQADPAVAAALAEELAALQQAVELLNGEIAARDAQIAALQSLEAAAPEPDPQAQAALLEAEARIADLTARLAALSERHSGSTATLEEVVLALTGQIEARDSEIATLRAALDASAAEVAAAASRADPAEIARLKAVNADGERHAAALAEQLSILQARHAGTTATQQERLAALNAQVEAQAAEMARMRNVNIQLRDAMRTLREAMATGSVDGSAINRALEAEVEALSSAREFERAELDALLAALDPLLVPVPATEAPEVVNA